MLLFLKTAGVCLAFFLIAPAVTWMATGSFEQAKRAFVGYFTAMGVIVAVAVLMGLVVVIGLAVS